MSYSLLKYKIIPVLALVLFISGCGYQPLYGTRANDQIIPISKELESVWVREIPDREGQLLHNELLTLFNPRGRPAEAKYILHILYSETTGGLGIGKDEFATRANLYANATFTLSGETNLQGSSRSVVNYNILTSPTGTEFSRIDARKRAIKALAQDIYRRVAIKILNQQDQETTQ